ncbi:hypothetical protein ACQY0O_007919 [Thecaphora frezii]
MKLPAFAFLLLLLLATIALALSLEERAKGRLVYTIEKGRGEHRVKQVKTRRSTQYRHFTTTATKTLHPRVTKTPAPLTQTATLHPTSTVTATNQAVTDVFTTTSNITSTITEAPTVTATETDTATTTATNWFTTTIGSGPTFTPILSSYPQGANARRGLSHSVEERDAPRGLHDHRGKDACRARYPQSVQCKKQVDLVTLTTYTKTGHARTITKCPQTITATRTQTVTSTSTVVPADVSSTVLLTATAITTTTLVPSTTTVTTTTTSTLKVDLPAATVYAGCQPDNFLHTLNGAYLISIIVSSDVKETVATASTREQCCQACLVDPNCKASYFGISLARCYTILGKAASGNCNSGINLPPIDVFYEPTLENTGYTLSYGACSGINLIYA